MSRRLLALAGAGVVLCGALVGTGAASRDLVRSRDMAAGAISTPKIRRGAVTAAKLRTGAVTASKLAPGSVTGAAVRNGSLTASDLAPGALAAGPTGPTGPTGAQGPTGPQGPQGPAGNAAAYGTWKGDEEYQMLNRSRNLVIQPIAPGMWCAIAYDGDPSAPGTQQLDAGNLSAAVSVQRNRGTSAPYLKNAMLNTTNQNCPESQFEVWAVQTVLDGGTLSTEMAQNTSWSIVVGAPG